MGSHTGLPPSKISSFAVEKQPCSASGFFILYLFREKEVKENQVCFATYETLPPILKSIWSNGTKAKCHKTTKLEVCATLNKSRLALVWNTQASAFEGHKKVSCYWHGQKQPRAAAEYFGTRSPFSCKHPPFTLRALYIPGRQWQTGLGHNSSTQPLPLSMPLLCSRSHQPQKEMTRT